MTDDESDLPGCLRRLSELECPHCQATQWFLDTDNVGLGPDILGSIPMPYEDRKYACSACGRLGREWVVRQQSPKAFLQQPDPLHPMTAAAFAYWMAILRAHFPGDPRLADGAWPFVPATPEEVRARRDAYLLAHPVVEMRDQDGSRRGFPDLRRAIDWLEVMRPGDSLTFLHRDGGRLVFTRDGSGLRAGHSDPSGRLVTERPDVGAESAGMIVWCYLKGDVPGCERELQAAQPVGEPAAYQEYLRDRKRRVWPDEAQGRLVALRGGV